MAAQCQAIIVGGKRLNVIKRIAEPYLKYREDPKNADKTDEELFEQAEEMYTRHRVAENVQRLRNRIYR